jgi:hypothetical protein
MEDNQVDGYLVVVELRGQGWQQYAVLAKDEDCAKVLVGELLNTRDEPIELRRKLLISEIKDLALEVGELKRAHL